MTVLILVGIFAADATTAGEFYRQGWESFRAERWRDALKAFAEAAKHAPEGTSLLRYRDSDGIRHAHGYWPHYYMGLAHARLSETETSLLLKRGALQASLARLEKSSHARTAELRRAVSGALKKVEAAIRRRESGSSGLSPSFLDLKKEVEALAAAKNFEGALERIRTWEPKLREQTAALEGLQESIKSQQKLVVEGYLSVLSSRLESLTRSDPAKDVEATLRELRSARIPEHIQRDPRVQFQWLDGFIRLLESRKDSLASVASLSANKIESLTLDLDRSAVKALDAYSFTGFKAARRMSHSIRLARLNQFLDGRWEGTETRKTFEALIAGIADSLSACEKDLSARIERAGADLLREEMARYLKKDLQVYQNDAERSTRSIRGALHLRDSLTTRAKELFDPRTRINVAALRRLKGELADVASNVHFRHFPLPEKARALFAAGVAESLLGFLNGGKEEDVAGRAAPYFSRAFSYSSEADIEWRDSLSPRIRAVIDLAKKR